MKTVIDNAGTTCSPNAEQSLAQMEENQRRMTLESARRKYLSRPSDTAPSPSGLTVQVGLHVSEAFRSPPPSPSPHRAGPGSASVPGNGGGRVSSLVSKPLTVRRDSVGSVTRFKGVTTHDQCQ